MFERRGVAILTPAEYEKLREVASRNDKILMDVSLFTGMRYVELQWLDDHPEWFLKDRKCIELPFGVEKKVKRRNPNRYVSLSTLGTYVISNYFENKDRPKFLKHLPRWDLILKRYAKTAGLIAKDKSISAKTFRKTWECWLAVSYPDMLGFIALSQGHTDITSLNHYAFNVPFNQRELSEIKEKTAGWMDVN